MFSFRVKSRLYQCYATSKKLDKLQDNNTWHVIQIILSSFSLPYRSICLEVLCKKTVLKYCTKLTWKYLPCRYSVKFLINWNFPKICFHYRCFPVSFVIFLRKDFLREIWEWLFFTLIQICVKIFLSPPWVTWKYHLCETDWPGLKSD